MAELDLTQFRMATGYTDEFIENMNGLQVALEAWDIAQSAQYASLEEKQAAIEATQAQLDFEIAAFQAGSGPVLISSVVDLQAALDVRRPIIVDTVADLKALDGVAGQVYETLGRGEEIGFGAGRYLCLDLASARLAKFSASWTPDQHGDHTFSNGLVAVLMGDTVSAAQYGASRDLSEDNTTPIQAMLSSGHESVCIDGDYTVGGLNVSADGIAISILGTLRLADGINGALITVTGDDVTISGGVIDGNMQGQTTGEGAGVYCSGASRFGLFGAKITSARGTGLLSLGSVSITIRENDVSDCGGNGMYLSDGGTGTEICKNKVKNNGRHGIFLSSSTDEFDNPVVYRNEVTGNGSQGFDSGIKLSGCSDAEVAYNICEDNIIGAGIIIDNGSHGAKVSNNRCATNLDGIIIDDGCNESVVSENRCGDNAKDGIDVNDQTGADVFNNRCYGNGEKGILAWGARDGQIRENKCYNNNTSLNNTTDGGIVVKNNATTGGFSENMHVYKNRVWDDHSESATQRAGVKLADDTNNCRIYENELSKAHGSGVIVMHSSNNNNIYGNSGSVTDISTSESTNIKTYREKEGGVKSVVSNEITITHSSHLLDTSGGAASSDLYNIYGATEIGQIVALRIIDESRIVNIKNGLGNIQLDSIRSDFPLNHPQDIIALIWNGGNWLELSSSSNS